MKVRLALIPLGYRGVKMMDSMIINPAIPGDISPGYPLSARLGCILHYDMQQDGNRLIDLSGNNNHAIVSGALPVVGLGNRLVRKFDSIDDYINAGHDASLGNLPQISIEMWTFRTNQGEGNQGRYFDKGGKIAASCATSATRIDFRRTFSTTNGYWYSDTKIVTTRWQHIVITYDGSSIENNPVIYIDGVPVTVTRNTKPAGNMTDDTNDDLYLGNKSDTNGTWNGSIGIISMYNRILTPLDITMLKRENSWLYGLTA